MASLRNDSDDRTLFSRSLLSRRQRPSQANVRSTVHRIGSFHQASLYLGGGVNSLSPLAFSGTHSYSLKLWYFESANILATLPIGWPSSRANSSGAAAA